MVKYVYDAWGNHAVLDANGNDISDGNHIGNLNPFRYRSYFYDVETELYYLQTRYYDPEVGRFITIDGIKFVTTKIINGLNLYAYCCNSPLKYFDLNGNIPFASSFFKAFLEQKVWGFNNKWLGRIDYSITTISEQTSEAGFFYAYLGNGTSISNNTTSKNVYGIGVNCWDWFGIDINVDSEININVGINITPWFHLNASVGLNGISIGAGVTINGKSHDFTIGIGLAPIALLAAAAIAIFDGGAAFNTVLSWFGFA